MDTNNMGKDDIFKVEPKCDALYKRLANKEYLQFDMDHKIVQKYIDGKMQGNYRHILYDINAPKKTVYKNLLVLRKLSFAFDKPISELTEEDIYDFQKRINNDEILYEDKTKCISWAYKRELIRNLKQFWQFYRVYAKFEKEKEVSNIVEYLKLRKNKKSSEIIKFLTIDEVSKLAETCVILKMKALLKVFFETGARTVEILNLQRYHCSKDERTGKWIVKLPNMKGISTDKVPIELDYANSILDIYLTTKHFEPEDYLFDYSYQYFRKKLNIIGLKYLRKRVTPKMFRKSCAMHLVNLNVNEQYIRSHMGWASNSKAISHYINQRAIKRPDKMNFSNEKTQTEEVVELREKLRQMEQMLMQKIGN